MKLPNIFKRFFKTTNNPNSFAISTNTINPFVFGSVNAKTSDQNYSIVNRCMTLLTDLISKQPINVYQIDNTGKNIILRHPLQKLFRYKPNVFFSSKNFKAYMISQFLKYGNFFAYIKRDALGRIQAIYPLNSANVSRTIYFIGNTKYYQILLNNNLSYTNTFLPEPNLFVNADDMIHVADLLDENGFFGISRLQAAQKNIETLENTNTTLNKYYENNLNTSKVVYTDENFINQDQLNEIREEIDKYFSGQNNAGKTIVLPNGYKLESIPLTYSDSIFISSNKFSSEMICTALGVPKSLVGLTDSKVNNEVEMLMLKQNTLHPMMINFMDEINLKCLSDGELESGIIIDFDSDNLIELDTTTKINLYKNLFYMRVVNSNQIATKFGLPTFEGGDERVLQSNLMLQSQIDNQHVKDFGGSDTLADNTDN